MLKKIVPIVEVLALVAAAGFVIALFTGGSGSSSGSASGSAYGTQSGEQTYVASCAVCHGSSGQGGVGPRLGGGAVVESFPNAQDEIDVVKDGRGTMPSFGGRFDDEQIAAVVEYTRTGLG